MWWSDDVAYILCLLIKCNEYVIDDIDNENMYIILWSLCNTNVISMLMYK